MPAAAADRLAEDAVRLRSRGGDLAGIVDGHGRGLLAAATVSADGYRYGTIAVVAGGGEGHSAVAAAAADRLGEDAVLARRVCVARQAAGRDRSLVDDGDGAADRARATAAADRDVHLLGVVGRRV